MSTAYQKVMDSRQETVNDLIAMIESEGMFNNKSAWTSHNLLPYNPETEVKYKGINKLKLMLCVMANGYADPRFCTFKQLQSAGYKLEKGAKGVLCEKWIMPNETLARMSVEKRLKMTQEEIDEFLKKPPKVSFFYVYNISQVKKYPALNREKVEEMTPDDLTKLADKLIRSSECPVYEQELQGRAYYLPSKDEIHIPTRNVFKSSEAFIGTLLHEMGHSTGHETRLNRNMKGEFGSPSYAKEELIVELSTLFTNADLGIAPSKEQFEDTSDYLQSWLKGENPKELFSIIKESDKVSERIVSNYSKKMIKTLPKEKAKGAR
ncbi:MAG: ArdC family protein [Suipraeoptans sp.]